MWEESFLAVGPANAELETSCGLFLVSTDAERSPERDVRLEVVQL